MSTEDSRESVPVPPESKSLIDEGNDQEENEEEADEMMDYKEWKGMEKMESLCPRCGANGITRFLLHKIPHFRELIIASFVCEECNERNNEVTFGGEIQLQGCRYNLKATSSKDLNRQLVKSDSASILIPEIDFEIPPGTQKGEINTIEGILKTAAKNLAFNQPLRRIETPEIAAKLEEIIDRLNEMSEGTFLPFSLVVDDPAGNSFIENPLAPSDDPHLSVSHYPRNEEQDSRLGLQHEKGLYKEQDPIIEAIVSGQKKFGAPLNSAPGANVPTNEKKEDLVTEVQKEQSEEVKPAEGDGEEQIRLGRNEVVTIPSTCPNCGHMGDSHTAITDIPHFKEVLIMAFECKVCGFRTNEVKAAGSIPTYGTEMRLRIEEEEDMKRDLLKSDTAMVIIPEIDLVRLLFLWFVISPCFLTLTSLSPSLFLFQAFTSWNIRRNVYNCRRSSSKDLS
jgi:zinc finger protein